MTVSTELFLKDFAPLLQIWGGICLLFFYLDELLKKSPLKGRWGGSFKNFKECCFRLLTQYKDLTPSDARLEKLNSYYASIKTVEVDESPLWGTTRKSIYNLAKFGFFHIIILLLYIGFEGAFPNLYPVLHVVNLIAFIYILLNCLLYGKGIIQKSWSIYVSVALMLLFGVLFFFIPGIQNYISGFGVSRTTVTIITLLISTGAYLIALLFDYVRGIYAILKCNSAIRRINNSLFPLWTNYIVLESLPRFRQNIAKIKVFIIRLILLFTEDSESFRKKTGQERLQEYIQRRVDKLWPTLEQIMVKFPSSSE